ncbi:hypothetical protein ANRL2_02741 [Anaerolineae bacterium]|nr:hypothetical protein ANRL2_02741 [Anaerolineae bacterium]
MTNSTNAASDGHKFALPTIVRGPWTQAARQLAIDKEC